MTSSNDVVVLLDGSKTFWKTRTYLKVIIVQHASLKCLEVITFDPAIGIEYPRIYLDTALIASKLDQDIIEETYAQKKEVLNRQKISKKKEELVEEIKLNMIKQYAYVRVNLVTDLPHGKTEVNLLPSFDDILVEGDQGANKIDVERLKPADLVPYEHKIVIVKSKVEEFKVMHAEMNKEVSLAGKELNNATRLATAALQGFFAAFRKKHRRFSIASNPRKRWIRAINKVIIQNYVMSVRKRLSKLALYKAFCGLTLLPDGTFLENSTSTTTNSTNSTNKNNNNAPKTLGGRKISGGLKGSFDDSHIIENFNRVFNGMNGGTDQSPQNNTPFNNSNNNGNNSNYNNARNTGNLDLGTLSSVPTQDAYDDVDTNTMLASSINFFSHFNNNSHNNNNNKTNTNSNSNANTPTSAATTATYNTKASFRSNTNTNSNTNSSQKMLGPRRTSGGMRGSFDDSDLYFSRHHNITFNTDSFSTKNNTTTSAEDFEDEEEDFLPPINGILNSNSLQSAVSVKMFHNKSTKQRPPPIDTKSVYGASIKSATDTGLANLSTNSGNNSNTYNNSNNTSNSIKSPNRTPNRSPSRARHTDLTSLQGIPFSNLQSSDNTPLASPYTTPRNVTFSVDNTPCATPRLAPIGEQSTLFSTANSSNTSGITSGTTSKSNKYSPNNSANNSMKISPQALAQQFERNNEKSVRKAQNLTPLHNRNTAAWENRTSDVVNYSALARVEKEKQEKIDHKDEKTSIRKATSRDEERSTRRIPLHCGNSSHNSSISSINHNGTNSTENSFRKLPLSRENSVKLPSGSGISGISHENHIHGLKLVKKVGSFRLSDAPKSMTNLHSTALAVEKSIGSNSNSSNISSKMHTSSSSTTVSPNNSVRIPNNSSSGHLAQMKSLRRNTNSNDNFNNKTSSNTNSSFVNGLNSAINSAFNSQCNSVSNTAQNSAYNSAYNSAFNSAYNSLNNSRHNSSENLAAMVAKEFANDTTTTETYATDTSTGVAGGLFF